MKAHNDSFDQLLRYIPAKYYIHSEETPKPSVRCIHFSRSFETQTRVASAQAPLTKAQKKAAKKKANDVNVKAAKSEALKKARIARVRARRRLLSQSLFAPPKLTRTSSRFPPTFHVAQYDPDEPKTIPEIQKAQAEAAKKGKERADEEGSDWEDEGSSAGEDEEEEEEADSANDTDFADSDDEAITVPVLRRPSENEGPAPSITELREKLQQRIADIQAHKRGAAGEEKEGEAKSKEELLEERRRRGVLRDNRRKKRRAERREEKPRTRDNEPSNGRKGGGKANAPPKEPKVWDEDRRAGGRGGDDEAEERPRKKTKVRFACNGS